MIGTSATKAAIPVIFVIVLIGSLAAQQSSQPAGQATYEQLFALIKPQPQESKWTRIPWLSSLWEARRRAAAEGKPILLWEMDGNPLGCT